MCDLNRHSFVKWSCAWSHSSTLIANHTTRRRARCESRVCYSSSPFFFCCFGAADSRSTSLVGSSISCSSSPSWCSSFTLLAAERAVKIRNDSLLFTTKTSTHTYIDENKPTIPRRSRIRWQRLRWRNSCHFKDYLSVFRISLFPRLRTV